MNHHWISNISNFALRKRVCAGLFVPVVIAACGGSGENAQNPGIVMAPVMATGEAPTPAASAPPAETALAGNGVTSAFARSRVYSVINLGPEASAAALLNERGQAAFGAINSDGLPHWFFDGDRVHELKSLGGSHMWIRALNDQGVVVGESEDNAQPRTNIVAFTWTVGGGPRALSSMSGSSAYDINEKGHIVGLMPSPGISARAVRWNPDGSVTNLGSVPPSLSEALAINDDGIATGFADIAPGGRINATVWDLVGTTTELGLGFGFHINARGAVAGTADLGDREGGFFWTARDGWTGFDVQGGGSRLVSALNDHNELVGNTTIADSTRGYFWSRSRGVVLLPIGQGIQSDAFDLNSQTEIVGSIRLPESAGGGLRAVRWSGPANPIDLNTQLYRAPAGLLLYAGAAINDKGVILAHSNAGLVMLRPGKRGTDAPVLGPLVGLPYEVNVGQQVALTVGFIDSASGETHIAAASWSDNCPSPQPRVSESAGTGEVTLQHSFCAPGYYSVKVKVTDSAGRSTEVRQEFVVNAPAPAL